MRIARLDLTAFGCFTDKQLEFSAGSPDFHLVYGDNEAGKTTALTAVRELLYGIHPQSHYNFQHHYRELRIGGRLCPKDKAECEVIRKKGNKNTLLGPDENPLDEGMLQSVLAAMEQEQFERVFALTHEDLVAGGQEIINGEGDVGEALFAAGLGGVRLNKLRRSMQDRAEEIFTPLAHKRPLNEKLKRVQDLDARIRELQLSGRQWSEHGRKVEKKKRELKKLTDACESLEQQRSKLQRLKRTIPWLAQLEDLSAQLSALGDVVTLPDDFEDRLHAAQQLSGEEGRRLEQLEGKIQQATDEANAIEIPEDLLPRREEIEGLVERLGAHKKGQRDVEKLRNERDTHTFRMKELAASLPGKPHVQTAVGNIPDVAARSAVEELAAEKSGLEGKLGTASGELNTIIEQVETLETQLAEAPESVDTASLQRAAAEVRRSGDIEEMLQRCTDELAQDEKAAVRQLGQLPLWHGQLAETLTLEVPMKSTVNRFSESFRVLDAEQTQLDERTAGIDQRESAIRQELKEMELTGTVPLEADVTAARRARNDGWELIRRRFLQDEDVELNEYAPDGDPGAVYEDQVQTADDTVDRLRNAAEIAHRRAQFEAELGELKSGRDEVEKRAAECHKRREQLSEEWREQWTNAEIDPLSPEEMREWLDDLMSVRAAAVRVSERQAEHDALQSELTGARKRLEAELTSLGENGDEDTASLSAMLTKADDVVEREENTRSAREQLVRDVDKARSDLQSRARSVEEAEKALENWTKRWTEAVSVLELGESPTVNQAREILRVFDELHDEHGNAEDLEKRIKGIERDARQFEADVSALIQDIAPDLAQSRSADAMRQLQGRLATADRDGARLERLTEELKAHEEDLKLTSEQLEKARRELAALSELAECDVEELRDAWRCHSKCEDLQTELVQVTEQLEREGDGRPLAELEAEARDRDLDLVNVQLQTSTEEAQALNEQRDQQREVLWALERQFEAMDGRDEAAVCAEQRQSLIAEVRDETEQYLTLAVARQLLAEAIESFRAENEEPMLERAGAFFERMTDGSFSGLDLQYRDADRPVLVGLRGDGGPGVTVDGMSDGTCDQLYLALRLAHVERLREHSEPLPLILDDILIRFDDDRARNTLAVLGEVGLHNQVIFFTHHRRLQQLATDALGESGYQLHEL